MSMNRQFTAVIEREGDGYVSFCPEVDVASQGDTAQEASANLPEAVELFFETASEDEILMKCQSTSLSASVKRASTEALSGSWAFTSPLADGPSLSEPIPQALAGSVDQAV